MSASYLKSFAQPAPRKTAQASKNEVLPTTAKGASWGFRRCRPPRAAPEKPGASSGPPITNAADMGLALIGVSTDGRCHPWFSAPLASRATACVLRSLEAFPNPAHGTGLDSIKLFAGEAVRRCNWPIVRAG